MAAIARPLSSTVAEVATVELRCPAIIETRGGPCGRLLAKVAPPPGPYPIELACPRCHTCTTFEVTGG